MSNQQNSSELQHGEFHGRLSQWVFTSSGTPEGNAVAAPDLAAPASCFEPSFLTIGSWKIEEELEAKIFFSKRKFVWEMGKDDFKKKIEFKWSDTKDVKADLPPGLPGTLSIELASPPKFYDGTRPGRQTKWQETSDFSDGCEATKVMKHVLQCPPGMLDHHVYNLENAKPPLHSLSLVNHAEAYVKLEKRILRDDQPPADEMLHMSEVQSFQNLLKLSAAENQASQMNVSVVEEMILSDDQPPADAWDVNVVEEMILSDDQEQHVD